MQRHRWARRKTHGKKPAGCLTDSTKFIVDELNKRKLGSGSIAARKSESTTAVGRFLFQMDNS